MEHAKYFEKAWKEHTIPLKFLFPKMVAKYFFLTGIKYQLKKDLKREKILTEKLGDILRDVNKLRKNKNDNNKRRRIRKSN